MNAHETLRPLDVRPSSDRSFGLVFAAFFTLVALTPAWSGRPVRWWAFGVAALFLILAWLKPLLLAPLNRVWTALGHLLGRITTPIVLGILFYGVFTPYGWVMRRAGRILLRAGIDRAATSYWIPRQPPGPEPGSMTRQF